MKRDIPLVLALVAIIWLSAALVRTENERYALSLGMCKNAQSGTADYSCLANVQTRTGWWWHIYYGLLR